MGIGRVPDNWGSLSLHLVSFLVNLPLSYCSMTLIELLFVKFSQSGRVMRRVCAQYRFIELKNKILLSPKFGSVFQNFIRQLNVISSFFPGCFVDTFNMALWTVSSSSVLLFLVDQGPYSTPETAWITCDSHSQSSWFSWAGWGWGIYIFDKFLGDAGGQFLYRNYTPFTLSTFWAHTRCLNIY